MIRIATNEDHQAVTEVLNKYLEAKKGDTTVLKEAFTENALLNNGPIEGLHCSVEPLGQTEFNSRIDSIDIAGKVAVARVIIEDWRTYYNSHRPHSALGNLTAKEFAEITMIEVPLVS